MARLERLAASPGRVGRLVAAAGAMDPLPELDIIRVPTLVLHRSGDQFIDPRHSQEYAAAHPGRTPGADAGHRQPAQRR